MTAAAAQFDLIYTDGQPIDTDPRAPYLTRNRARQVITWHQLGVNPRSRFIELYGSENVPDEPAALLRDAYATLQQGELA